MAWFQNLKSGVTKLGSALREAAQASLEEVESDEDSPLQGTHDGDDSMTGRSPTEDIYREEREPNAHLISSNERKEKKKTLFEEYDDDDDEVFGRHFDREKVQVHHSLSDPAASSRHQAPTLPLPRTDSSIRHFFEGFKHTVPKEKTPDKREKLEKSEKSEEMPELLLSSKKKEDHLEVPAPVVRVQKEKEKEASHKKEVEGERLEPTAHVPLPCGPSLEDERKEVTDSLEREEAEPKEMIQNIIHGVVDNVSPPVFPHEITEEEKGEELSVGIEVGVMEDEQTTSSPRHAHVDEGVEEGSHAFDGKKESDQVVDVKGLRPSDHKRTVETESIDTDIVEDEHASIETMEEKGVIPSVSSVESSSDHEKEIPVSGSKEDINVLEEVDQTQRGEEKEKEKEKENERCRISVDDGDGALQAEEVSKEENSSVVIKDEKETHLELMSDESLTTAHKKNPAESLPCDPDEFEKSGVVPNEEGAGSREPCDAAGDNDDEQRKDSEVDGWQVEKEISTLRDENAENLRIIDEMRKKILKSDETVRTMEADYQDHLKKLMQAISKRDETIGILQGEVKTTRDLLVNQTVFKEEDFIRALEVRMKEHSDVDAGAVLREHLGGKKPTAKDFADALGLLNRRICLSLLFDILVTEEERNLPPKPSFLDDLQGSSEMIPYWHRKILTKTKEAWSERKRLQGRVKDMSTKIENMQQEMEDAFFQIEKYRVEESSETQKLRQRLEETEFKYKEYEHNMKEMKHELESQLVNAHDQIMNLEEELDRERMRREELEEDRAMDREDISRMEKESARNEALTSRLATLEEQHAHLLEQHELLTVSHENLESALSQVEKERQYDRKHVYEPLREKAIHAEELQREVEELKSRLSDDAQRYEHMSSELSQLRLDVRATREENLHLRSECSDLRDSLDVSMSRLQNILEDEQVIDRGIAKQLVVTYVQKGHPRDVLRVISRMFHFDEVEQRQAGLLWDDPSQEEEGEAAEQKHGWFSSLIGGIGGSQTKKTSTHRPSKGEEQQGNDDGSLADMWIKFLVEKSEEEEEEE